MLECLSHKTLEVARRIIRTEPHDAERAEQARLQQMTTLEKELDKTLMQLGWGHTTTEMIQRLHRIGSELITYHPTPTALVVLNRFHLPLTPIRNALGNLL